MTDETGSCHRRSRESRAHAARARVILVEDLDAAIAFFTELGLMLEGRMPIEGQWAGG